MPAAKRFLGITVMTPYIQNEGIDGILANLVDRAGATAVATNTSVTTPAPDGVGAFQPPDDAGASVRLFDRPLWNQHALWLPNGDLPVDGVWINRYGYLSDEKLDIIRAVWH